VDFPKTTPAKKKGCTRVHENHLDRYLYATVIGGGGYNADERKYRSSNMATKPEMFLRRIGNIYACASLSHDMHRIPKVII
jgi:hypothetical protein